MEATSLAQVDTIYSADSIEFCPQAGYERWFTCGTYQLLPAKVEGAGGDGKGEKQEEEGETKSKGGDDDSDSDSDIEEHTPAAPRVGRLYLFSLGDGDDVTPRQAQQIETSAILDAKWNPNTAIPELAVADAKGRVTLYDLTSSSSSSATATSSGYTTLAESTHLQLSDESTLILSLDHAPNCLPSRSGDLMTSVSDGTLAHVTRAESELVVSDQWQAHDFEPWITAWDTDPSGNIVWSGGDDCKLKKWDLRATGMSVGVCRRFDGGVTTIAACPWDENLVAVGSYDATLRLFDKRALSTPLKTIELPGGIWRTRWHPSPERRGDILNACMHGGFAVVRFSGIGAGAGDEPEPEPEPEIIKTFPGTLGYGADWCRADYGAGESVVATCSFYDHVMHVWRA